MTEAELGQSSSSPLRDQVAVVTGAARGIGEAVARRLARLGAIVVLTARDQTRLMKVRTLIGEDAGEAVVMPCDLTNVLAVEALGEDVRKQLGRCDILVNNAGIGLLGKPLVELEPEEWDRVLHTNLRAPYLMIRALAPMMISRGYGHIINISSLAGKSALPNGTAYAASKWGLNGLTYSVAEELRQHNVRTTVIAPGSVNTHFSGGPDHRKDLSKLIQPSDIADIVATLVTQPQASFISEILVRPTVKP